MAVIRIDIHGSPNIGVYTLTTDSYTIVPVKLSKSKAKLIEDCLNVEIIETTIGGSFLVGVLASANSNGIVLPHYAYDEEMKAIKKRFDVNVEKIECRKTAFGNLVLANDNGAIIDPNLMRETEIVKRIEDALGVEATQGTIAGLPYVGSLAVATNKGAVSHPMIKEEELKLMQDMLKVPVDVGTVNLGVPYVSSGLMANTNGAIVGHLTTGPEIFIIGQALNVIT